MTGENGRLDDSGVEEATLFADDEFYRALAARPRRQVMGHLLEREQSSVDELAAVLCGWETMDEAIVSTERHEAVRIELIHKHLPRLADAGLVAYDRSTERVTLGELDGPAKDLVRRGMRAERQ